MEKSILIYIDQDSLSDSVKEFVNKIRDRISRIKANLNIITYADIDSSKKNTSIQDVLKIMNKSDIVISIIDNAYLNEVENDEKFKQSIIKAQESKEKYFFPIIFSPTNWINADWLIKSKLYPPNLSIEELDDKSVNEQIEIISKKIESIVFAMQNTEEIVKTKSVVKGDILKNSDVVFISHSHEDGDFAELLQHKLNNAGINSWLDNERLKIGQDWREEIDSGIANSLAVVVIMTPDAKNSEYVTYEWSFAWGKGVRVFPVMLKQTTLHPRLESLQYLNFSNRDSRPWSTLLASIKSLKT